MLVTENLKMLKKKLHRPVCEADALKMRLLSLL